MLSDGLKARLRVPVSESHISNVWINDDIRPLPPSRRSWTTWAFTSFWAINQIALTNWQLGSTLVASGLSVWQTMIAVILGKMIIAAVAIANGYVGAEWHIGYPIVSRYIWGIYGHYFLLAQRILLSLVWFAVQAWTGGLCVMNVLSAIFPSFQNMKNHFPESANMTTRQFVGWIVFLLLMVPVIWVKPERIHAALLWMNIVAATTLICMMIWALSAADGAGPLLSQAASPMSSSELGWTIVHGITTTIGGIAVGLTNQPDYSRFARKPGDQVFGQWFSVILFGTIFPLFGCLASSATQKIYGEAIWNPPLIAQQWLDSDYNAKSRAGAFFAGIGLVINQIAINSVDNAYSAGMDMAGLFPKWINIRRGAFIGLLLSMALCPWELLSSAAVFISVLSAYSVFLGPVIGIQITDYWLLRHRKVKLSDLYHPRPEGIYFFWHGFNVRAFAAWVTGFASQLPGFINAIEPSITVPVACTRLYYLAFLLGAAISALVHYALNRIWPPPGMGDYDSLDYFGTFTEAEAAKMGVEPYGGDVSEADILNNRLVGQEVEHTSVSTMASKH
ncbi:NCS1 nucleoside transporter [Phlyctema vagabunda]|uniref:NCS1 nucleoside transporter n=1 Tax=Phlyctema vagabunda TaxID=108571 RepID=A0ABR4PFL1_9HELO